MAFSPTDSLDVDDGQREYNRQREYLEKEVESMKRKLVKGMQISHNDMMRLKRENAYLTNQVNDLRREFHTIKTHQNEIHQHQLLKKQQQSQPLHLASNSGSLGAEDNDNADTLRRELALQKVISLHVCRSGYGGSLGIRMRWTPMAIVSSNTLLISRGIILSNQMIRVDFVCCDWTQTNKNVNIYTFYLFNQISRCPRSALFLPM
jgi:hypothetical protein